MNKNKNMRKNKKNKIRPATCNGYVKHMSDWFFTPGNFSMC